MPFIYHIKNVDGVEFYTFIRPLGKDEKELRRMSYTLFVEEIEKGKIELATTEWKSLVSEALSLEK